MNYSPYSQILIRIPLQSLNDVTSDVKVSGLFDEGIFLSSPSFWSEVKALPSNPTDKIKQSLLKYWIRSCTRPTPFGTFAGCLLLDVEATSGIVINEAEFHRKSIRLDMGLFMTWFSDLVSRQEIRRQLKYSTNNSLYLVGSNYRYAEFTLFQSFRKYQLTSVKKTPYIEFVVDYAVNSRSFEELSVALRQRFDVSLDEVQEFIDGLIDSQILVSNLEPRLTSEDPLIENLAILKEISGAEEIVALIENVQQSLNVANSSEQFRSIQNDLKRQVFSENAPKNLIQVDTFISASEAKIDASIVTALVNQLDELKFLSKKTSSSDLEDFKSKFSQKFDKQEVPLFTALDAEVGVGYGSGSQVVVGAHEFSEKLIVGAAQGSRGVNFDKINDFVLGRYLDFLKSGHPEILITDKDIKAHNFETEQIVYTAGQYIFGSMLKRNGQFNSREFDFLLTGMSGPSAGRLLGRFSTGDTGVANLLRDILQTEDSRNDDIIYAEIIHLPDDRLGNVLLRASARKFEIPYLGKANVDNENQIPISDLVVRVFEGEVQLRSKKHNKRVIPRLTSAHNFSVGSLPIYRMLCDLQLQGYYSFSGWNWGILSGEKFLPRVKYKNVILSAAQWRVSWTDLPKVSNDLSSFYDEVERWRKVVKIPRRVAIIDQSGELFIDFSSREMVDLLLRELRKRGELILEEYLFDTETCIVHNTNGEPFCNEVVIPLKSESKGGELPGWTTHENLALEKSNKRKFGLNEEWLYLKLFVGNSHSQDLLLDSILPFVEEFKGKYFDQFFFVRYFDKFPQLRVRFLNQDASRNRHLLTSLKQILDSYRRAGIISSIQLDDYDRELERYGVSNFPDIETLFHWDSLAVLRFLDLARGNEEKYLWLFAMRSIDMTLSDFGYDLDAKWGILKLMKESFFKEFGSFRHLQKQLNDEYRIYGDFISSHMSPHGDVLNEIDEATAIFNERSAASKTCVRSILMRNDSSILASILPSIIHMSMNRFFTANQRKCELFVYHFLEKYYKSQVAIQKNHHK